MRWTGGILQFLALLHLSFILQKRNAVVAADSGAFYILEVDGSRVIAPLQRFWRSTGFCPPLPHENFRDYVLTDDELQNIALIGSVAREGIKQVRIHWLFDLLKVTGESKTSLSYDFSDLDTLLDWLHRSQLQPGFELMGNPSGYFTDFDNKSQVYLWKDLVQQVATHYIKRYGLDEVSQWNFETWNEPSNGDFDKLHVSIPGFLAYYDACSEGLKAVSNALRLGGPGDGCTLEKHYCWPFLQHCANGTNYFTGETGVRLDYISFHHKGKSTSEIILNTTTETIQYIRQRYPQLSHVDIYNDEADPQGGWNKLLDWRGDVHYAAMVVKIIVEHQNEFLSTPDKASFTRFSLLSNDNGFMNWDPLSHFNQRTLTTRFRMNLTHPRSVEMVKKPVLGVMSLLAMLGENQVETNFQTGEPGVLGAIASTHNPNASNPHDSWELVVLLYFSDDTSAAIGGEDIQLNILNANPPNASAGNVAVKSYQMTNEFTNPYRIWSLAGKPAYPSKDLFARMRGQQEPVPAVPGPVQAQRLDPSLGVVDGNTYLTLTMPLPGVTLVHLCQSAPVAPPQVTGLWLHNVTSSEVLVLWQSVDVRCLSTYEILYSTSSGDGTFQPANKGASQISTSFIHALSEEDLYRQSFFRRLTITYQVLAVDYMDRKGPPSEPVSITMSP